MNMATLSKKVGWEQRDIKYPSLRDVKKAETILTRKDGLKDGVMYIILTWHRFLPSPANQEQQGINSMILGLYEYMCDHVLQKGGTNDTRLL